MSFQTRLDHVALRFNDINGELVSIDRPGAAGTTTGVTASPIIMRAEEFYPGVSETRIELQDWCIDVVDYQIDGVAVKPLPKDTITRADGSVFRVIGLGDDQPAYTYTTSNRNRLKIHSERITDPTTVIPENDDTPTIQALLDAGGAVVLPAGTYVVGDLVFPTNVSSVTGPNTILKLKSYSTEWARVFYITHSVAGNRTVDIHDLTFDMNRENQGAYENFELEHQAAILATGEGSTGFLTVNIDNVTVYESAGDAIYVHHRAVVNIDLCHAHHIFRAGIGITGHNSTTNITNTTLLPEAGIDVEPNVDSHVVVVNVNNVNCEDFDVALTVGSSFTANDVTAYGILYAYSPPGATFLVTNSTFSNRYNFRLPNVTFENCTFNAPAGEVPINIIRILWNHGSFTQDMVCTLTDCIIQGPATNGIDTGIDTAADNNTLALTNVEINDVDQALEVQNGPDHSIWLFDNVTHDGVPVLAA